MDVVQLFEAVDVALCCGARCGVMAPVILHVGIVLTPTFLPSLYSSSASPYLALSIDNISLNLETSCSIFFD